MKPFSQRPQFKAIVVQTLTRTPRKPNSAKRKIAQVRVQVKRNVFKLIYAYIPGIGHSLKKHNVVLVRHCNLKDLPGVEHKIIRGVYDCTPVEGRVTSLTKYGKKK